MQSFCAGISGGELDGVVGVLMHAREKGSRMFNRTLALLSLPEVPQVSCQHWVGIFCFMAQFRRPVFSAVQDLFPFIVSFSEDQSERRTLPPQVFDEILLGSLLAPLAFSNLRCQVHSRISIPDASEEAGASAEASVFLPYLNSELGTRVDDAEMSLVEASATVLVVPNKCSKCESPSASLGEWAFCGIG